MKTGVLALQGSYFDHVKSLELIDKEYTFNCDNTQVFEDSLCKELISIELKTGGSVGKFLHNQIKEGLIIESK